MPKSKKMEKKTAQGQTRYNLRERKAKEVPLPKKPRKNNRETNPNDAMKTPKRSCPVKPRRLNYMEDEVNESGFYSANTTFEDHDDRNMSISQKSQFSAYNGESLTGRYEWLQERRDVPLYVECCNIRCKKWRFVEEFHDPTDVPEIWFCRDGNYSCSEPEERLDPKTKNDLIENKYTAGTLVWARYPGYPWWPAMVCDDPVTFRYYELRGESQVPMVYRKFDYSDMVERAYIRCKQVFDEKLTITERLEQYGFLSMYRRLYRPTISVCNTPAMSMASSFRTYVSVSSSLTHVSNTPLRKQILKKSPMQGSIKERTVNEDLGLEVNSQIRYSQKSVVSLNSQTTHVSLSPQPRRIRCSDYVLNVDF